MDPAVVRFGRSIPRNVAASRCELRRVQAEPVWDTLEIYLAELAQTALPKSALAKAVKYARNQWVALQRYTQDGQLTIDNNTAERTLRHQAVGGKNWLFLGSEKAGPRAAVLYTILAGAKRQRIEPWSYLRELLLRVNADDPKLEEMLSDRWAATGEQATCSRASFPASILERSRMSLSNSRRYSLRFLFAVDY
jgi:transposase